jgi:hypothetical protein
MKYVGTQLEVYPEQEALRRRILLGEKPRPSQAIVKRVIPAQGLLKFALLDGWPSFVQPGKVQPASDELLPQRMLLDDLFRWLEGDWEALVIHLGMTNIQVEIAQWLFRQEPSKEELREKLLTKYPLGTDKDAMGYLFHKIQKAHSQMRTPRKRSEIIMAMELLRDRRQESPGQDPERDSDPTGDSPVALEETLP